MKQIKKAVELEDKIIEIFSRYAEIIHAQDELDGDLLLRSFSFNSSQLRKFFDLLKIYDCDCNISAWNDKVDIHIFKIL